MAIKLIAMDIDDTLTTSFNHIPLRNKWAIRRAVRKGVKIVLASGRPTESMMNIAKKLGIDKNGYILSYNGAFVVDLANNKTIHSSALTNDSFHKLLGLSKQHDLYMHTYLGDEIYTERDNEYTRIESNITGFNVNEVNSLAQVVKTDVVKVLMLEHPEKLRNARELIEPQVSENMSVCFSKPYFLEFMQAGTDKGSSLARLADYLGIAQSEVMALGDSDNDISMIKWAGVGVAMGNGKDEVKSVADYVCPTNKHVGVAKTIRKFVLQNN